MNETRFNMPCEVMTQIRTFAWLLSNMYHNETVSKDQAYGLYLFAEMIADNVESMIDELEGEQNGEKNT